MKQFRDTKEAQRLLDTPLVKHTLGDVVGQINNEEILPLVKILDETAEDWEITEQLFLYAAGEILKGIEEEDNRDEPLFSEEVYNIIKKLRKAI